LPRATRRREHRSLMPLARMFVFAALVAAIYAAHAPS
jgi:hypothetical protein